MYKAASIYRATRFEFNQSDFGHVGCGREMAESSSSEGRVEIALTSLSFSEHESDPEVATKGRARKSSKNRSNPERK